MFSLTVESFCVSVASPDRVFASTSSVISMNRKVAFAFCVSTSDTSVLQVRPYSAGLHSSPAAFTSLNDRGVARRAAASKNASNSFVALTTDNTRARLFNRKVNGVLLTREIHLDAHTTQIRILITITPIGIKTGRKWSLFVKISPLALFDWLPGPSVTLTSGLTLVVSSAWR